VCYEGEEHACGWLQAGADGLPSCHWPFPRHLSSLPKSRQVPEARRPAALCVQASVGYLCPLSTGKGLQVAHS
jgi:hypothetical protein